MTPGSTPLILRNLSTGNDKRPKDFAYNPHQEKNILARLTGVNGKKLEFYRKGNLYVIKAVDESRTSTYEFKTQERAVERFDELKMIFYLSR